MSSTWANVVSLHSLSVSAVYVVSENLSPFLDAFKDTVDEVVRTARQSVDAETVKFFGSLSTLTKHLRLYYSS